MQNTLLVLKGLPASGKSTYAESLVEQGYVRVNKDTIRLDPRLFPDGYNFKNRSHEKKVIKERNRQIIEALGNNKDVVVDDTNLNPVHIKDILNIAKQHGATFMVDDSFMQVPLHECIERDKNREDSVGESAIRGMYHQFIRKSPQALEYDPALPMAVICDIDGTLAHMNGKRNPYDWHKVGLDDVDEGVAHLIDALRCVDYAKVFLFSGRNEVCRPETEEWLERNDIDYDALYMRPQFFEDGKTENNLDDRVIKADMLRDHIVGKYNVLFVVDDRPKVCRMWRDDFGLRTLQVGDPHYEF